MDFGDVKDELMFPRGWILRFSDLLTFHLQQVKFTFSIKCLDNCVTKYISNNLLWFFSQLAALDSTHSQSLDWHMTWNARGCDKTLISDKLGIETSCVCAYMQLQSTVDWACILFAGAVTKWQGCACWIFRESGQISQVSSNDHSGMSHNTKQKENTLNKIKRAIQRDVRMMMTGRVKGGKERRQQGRDCGNNNALFHSIF